MDIYIYMYNHDSGLDYPHVVRLLFIVFKSLINRNLLPSDISTDWLIIIFVVVNYTTRFYTRRRINRRLPAARRRQWGYRSRIRPLTFESEVRRIKKKNRALLKFARVRRENNYNWSPCENSRARRKIIYAVQINIITQSGTCM